MDLDGLEDNYQFQHLKNQNKIHNIFFSYKNKPNMVLTTKILDDILEYLEKSIDNLAKESIENLEIDGGLTGITDFLENQLLPIFQFCSLKNFLQVLLRKYRDLDVLYIF